MRNFSKKTQSLIDKYYKDNQEVLNEAGYDKNMFESNVKILMKTNNIRAKRAIRVFEHKTDFTDKTVIGAENLIKGIKNMDKQAYHDLRKDVIGWKNKVDYSKFTYDKDTEKYQYTNNNGDVFIFTLINGPYGSQYWEWKQL